MTIDKEKLKALAEHAVASNPHGGDGNPFPALAVRAVDVLALLAEIERLEAQGRLAGVAAEVTVHQEVGREITRQLALTQERDELKAENEALRKAMSEISGQVDGNIRCTVRDVVNGLPDVQDIYGYCDTIDEIIEAAMAKGAIHD